MPYVDEKNLYQAFELTRPDLPVALGYVEGITHDSPDHGTTTLLAVLDVANGTTLTHCQPRARHKEFPATTWLARRLHFHPHFTVTYDMRLNQVERWRALIAAPALRRSSFDSVADLKCRIDELKTNYERRLKPLMWTATTRSILPKIAHPCHVDEVTAGVSGPDGDRCRGARKSLSSAQP